MHSSTVLIVIDRTLILDYKHFLLTQSRLRSRILAPLPMNFDEFRASSERDRLRKKEQREVDATKTSARSTAVIDSNEEKILRNGVGNRFGGFGDIGATLGEQASRHLGLDDFLEMPQMQSFVVLMLLLDTFAATMELYLLKLNLSRVLNSDASGFPINDFLLAAVHYFTSFSIFFFAIEIFSVMVVFKSSSMGHVGYVIDFIIIWLQLCLELSGTAGRETRLLNIFRVWRTMRLFNSMIDVEKRLHSETLNKLNRKDIDCRKLTLDLHRLEIDLNKEREAKDSIEDMLIAYKEEVDTLNEALKIAAMDIAEVALTDDDFNPDSARVRLEHDDDAHFVDAPSFEYDTSKNRSTLRRLATNDISSPVHINQTTFVIDDDGSFKSR